MKSVLHEFMKKEPHYIKYHIGFYIVKANKMKEERKDVEEDEEEDLNRFQKRPKKFIRITSIGIFPPIHLNYKHKESKKELFYDVESEGELKVYVETPSNVLLKVSKGEGSDKFWLILSPNRQEFKKIRIPLIKDIDIESYEKKELNGIRSYRFSYLN